MKVVKDAGKSDAGATRAQDPEGTRRNILDIASEEFALNGLSGARIDEIAARTRSSKRMIYYYFGDKEGLYLSALENDYRLVREGEAKLDTEDLAPLAALGRLVEFTFDHHHQHEEFIRMVMIENIHKGEYLERSKVIRKLNATAIDHLSRRGFRIDPWLNLLMSNKPFGQFDRFIGFGPPIFL